MFRTSYFPADDLFSINLHQPCGLKDRLPTSSTHASIKMPDNICGNWEMISNTNLEGYMVALGKLSNLVLNAASELEEFG